MDPISGPAAVASNFVTATQGLANTMGDLFVNGTKLYEFYTDNYAQGFPDGTFRGSNDHLDAEKVATFLAVLGVVGAMLKAKTQDEFDAIVAAAKAQLTGPLYQSGGRLLKVVTNMGRSFKA